MQYAGSIAVTRPGQATRIVVCESSSREEIADVLSQKVAFLGSGAVEVASFAFRGLDEYRFSLLGTQVSTCVREVQPRKSPPLSLIHIQ